MKSLVNHINESLVVERLNGDQLTELIEKLKVNEHGKIETTVSDLIQVAEFLKLRINPISSKIIKAKFGKISITNSDFDERYGTSSFTPDGGKKGQNFIESEYYYEFEVIVNTILSELTK